MGTAVKNTAKEPTERDGMPVAGPRRTGATGTACSPTRLPWRPYIDCRLPLPGVTLLLCTLGTKRAGISMDRNNDLVRVETAMDILKFAAPR
jgi:hypothetical protein